MIDLENKTSCKPDIPFLEKITQSLTSKDVELIITTNDEIATINKEFRNKEQPTDVLSFPLEEMEEIPLLGSIVISFDFVQQKADELGHTYMDELSLLYIHGLLHLLGYDHEVDNGQMREEEKRLIQQWNLPQSLIVRTQGV